MSISQSFYYSNLAVPATLGAAISSTAGTAYLSSVPSGYPAQFPWRAVISYQGAFEVVTVTSGSGTSAAPWVIERGQDGTTAQAWTTAAMFTHEATAGDYTLSRQHEGSAAAQLPHGLPSTAWLAGNFATINETTLANNSTSLVTWSSIPQTYKNLLILVQARLNETTLQSDDLTVKLNGDSSSVYSYLTISATNISGAGTGALGAVSGFTASAASGWPMFRVAASEAGTAVNAGGGVAWLPNYTGTAFNKMFVGLSGAGDGSSAMVDGRVRWGFYNPSAQAAVTSVSVSAPSGADFLTGSFFGLYGLG